MASVLRYGGGNPSPYYGADNFAGASVSPLSLCCTPIELLSNDGDDTVLSTASGFFWRKGGRPHLVTNWHVVSGRNAFTGELNPQGFIPKRIRFYGSSISIHGGEVRFARPPWVVMCDEGGIEMLSKPPNCDGQDVDIWAVPIPDGVVFGLDASRAGYAGADKASCFLNDHVGPRIVTNVGDDCFILGYPIQNYAGLLLPIWKRGAISSDTLIGVDGRPIFLVDAATTVGMSGSPIIRKVITVTAHNTDIGAFQEFTRFDLIGVYAGRLESKELSAVNIGYGWYKIMIDRVIDLYQALRTEFAMGMLISVAVVEDI